MNTPPRTMSNAELEGRFWPTAKALRALGLTVPDDIPDDTPVIYSHTPQEPT